MGIKRAKKTLGACQTRGRLDTHYKRGMKRAVAAAPKRRRGGRRHGKGAGSNSGASAA